MLFILLGINFVVHQYFLPYSWGDRDLHTKLTFYDEHQDKYNAVFIGGSLVYRHVNSKMIDSIAQANDFDFRSFNAGGDGIAYLKQARIMDDLLKDPNPNVEYMFMTLSSTSRFRFLNLHTKRFLTWQRPIDTWRAIQVSMTMPMSLRIRLKTSWFYIIALIENTLNIGLLTDAIEYLNHPEENYSAISLGPNEDGFLPYDLQEKIQYEEGSWEEDLQMHMIKSHHTYKSKAGRRDSITAKIQHEFETYNPNKVIQPMVKGYERLIKKCADKGIKLIVIMPPKTRENYDAIIPVFDQLPEANKINLADPRLFPEYYNPDNCYNFHHLNWKGANIFSKDLIEHIMSMEGVKTDLTNQNNNR